MTRSKPSYLEDNTIAVAFLYKDKDKDKGLGDYRLNPEKNNPVCYLQFFCQSYHTLFQAAIEWEKVIMQTAAWGHKNLVFSKENGRITAGVLYYFALPQHLFSKPRLPPCLIHRHRYRVCQIQAALPRQHGQFYFLPACNTAVYFLAQTFAFRAK